MKAKLKRLLSCLLTAALLLQMAPFEVLAADSSPTVSSPAVREDRDESTESTKTADEADYDDDVSPPDTYIDGEVMEARDEYEKHYRLTDGSFLAAQFQVPVHYEADGVWEDIDNTLIGVALYDGTEVYQSVNGEHVQSFASTLSDGTVLSVADGEQSLTMALWDGGQDTAEPPPAAVTEIPESPDAEEFPEPSEQPENEQESEPEETETPSEAGSADAPTVLAGESDDADGEKMPAEGDNEDTPSEELPEAATPEETVEPAPSPAASEDEADAADPTEPETIEEESEPEDTLPTFNREAKAEILTGAVSAAAVQAAPAMREVTDVVPETLENAVIYREVYPGVDLKYETFSYNVKESIILNAPAAQSEETDGAANDSRYVYTFRLTLEGLTPELQEDGSILLLNEAGETEYTIPAPFMEDNVGAVSMDAAYVLEEADEGWLLVVQADAAWLDAKDRAYPVVIDPTINKEFVYENVKGTSSYSVAYPNPYLAAYQMIVGQDPDAGELKMFFKVTELPKIPAGHTIIKSQIGLKMSNNFLPEPIYLGVRKMTSALTDAQYAQRAFLWDSQICYDAPMDYLKIDPSGAVQYYYWDCTSAANDWYEKPATNYGLSVTSVADSYKNTQVWLRFQRNQMTFLVNYRNTTGIESYYTYETQNAGRAGTGYVGDYSSELTVVKDDLSFPNTAMSFSLGHVFNSGLRSGELVTSDVTGISVPDYSKMKTGCGWQLSVQESIKRVTIDGVVYLIYRDGDGTLHYCPRTASAAYRDEDGLGLSIISGSVDGDYEYAMTDTDGNKKYFFNGIMMYMEDTSGNKICFLYNGKSYDSSSLFNWLPPASGAYLTSIVSVNKGQSAKTICTLSYTNDYLTAITDWAGRKTQFTYSSGRLTQITHPDGTSACYNYDDNGRLSEAYDGEGKYGVAYTYSGNDVTGIREYAAASQGGEKTYGSSIRRSKNGVQEAVYRYDGADHKFYPDDDTTDDIVTRYAFDYAGRTINAATLNWNETEILGVTAAAYTSSSGTSKTNNRVEKDAQSGQEGINLMTAGGLEVHDGMTAPGNSWALLQASGTGKNAAVKNTSSDSTTLTRTGNGSIKIYLKGTAAADADGKRRMGMYQEVNLKAGVTYTFSAYVNTKNVTEYVDGGGLYVAFLSSSGTMLSASDRITAVTNAEIDNGWQRIYATYTPAANGTYRVAAIQENAYLYGYFDDFQLETGAVPSNVNLLQNGSFQMEKNGAEWNLGPFHMTAIDALHPDFIEVHANPSYEKRASQTVPISGPATDTYLLSGWACATSTADTAFKLTDDTAENNTASRYFGLIAKCTYTDSTKEYFYMPFNDDYNGWQYASCVIAPKKANQGKTIQSITVFASYDHNINSAWFDSLSLRQEPCTTYTYDSDGNVTAVNATGNSSASFKYAAGTTDLTESNTKSSGTYKYTYNSNHLVTKIKNDGVTMDISYDASGNSTGTTLSSDSNSAVGKIVTSATYSADGSQLLSQTDANGSTTSYTYSNQRLVSTQTDANGVVNRHSYNSNNDRPSVNYQTNVVSAAYVYSCGNLVTLRRSSFAATNGPKRTQTYSMGYDSFGNMTSISVGSRQLASYDYGSQNGNLRSMTYGNGDVVSYSYDTLDRVTAEYWGGALKYQYFYNAEGDLSKKLDVTTGKAVNYEYDSLDRLIHSNQTDNGTVTSQTEHIYDTENRLKRFTYSIPGVIGSATESFYYNENTADGIPDGSLTSMALFNNSWIYYRYDSLFRRTERDIGSVLTEHQSFAAGSTSGTTTMRPETYYTTAKGSTTKLSGFQYTYDKVGNIKKIVNQVDSSYWNYSYDSLGQLRFASEYQSNGVASNRYKYFYDNAGNLTSWVIQDNSGTVTKVSHTYSYDDADWLDLLTAFDGETITYDGAGNPLSYYNGSRYTFTWQNGRQLASTDVGGVTYNYQYDASGIRTRKTNFDGGYTEYYVVEGLAVAEDRFRANGTKQYTLRYLYDESNSPVGFGIRYATSSPYWQYYYFGKNIQGDVIALYRSDYNSGSQSYYPTLVATYSYDPWGTPTGIYDANGNAISQTAYNVAAYNPFRYRGYRYDGDTRLYYLQSRYYDPAVGRFINADKYAGTGQGYLGYNMFAYCNNNPVRYVDVSGELAVEATIAATNFWNPIGWTATAVLIVEGIIVTGCVIALTREAVQEAYDTPSQQALVTPYNSAKSNNNQSPQAKSTSPAASVPSAPAPRPPRDNRPSLKRIANKMLKKLGLDAHSIKYEYLGKRAPISRFDLAYDTKSGIIYIIKKAGEIVTETHYNIWSNLK